MSSAKSSAGVGDPWSIEDDVRLIRGKECQMFGWRGLRQFFPRRNRCELDARYQLLANSKVNFLISSDTTMLILV
jgi:hypothetical protein